MADKGAMARALALTLLALILPSLDAHACAIVDGPPMSWIDRADVIVRARAVEQRGRKLDPGERRASNARGRDPMTFLGTQVRFQLIETVKGRPPSTLEFDGELVEWPDKNEAWLPRTMVRTGGRGGNCYALNYRPNAEYLLMLQRRNGQLTPYWAATGATNELVSGDRDPWLRWVKALVALRAARPPIDGTLPAACDPDMDLHPERPCHFALGHDPLSLHGNGTVTRLNGKGGAVRLPLLEGMLVERVLVADRGDHALLVYEASAGGYGYAAVARIDTRTLALAWHTNLPSFNGSDAAIESDVMYVATLGAVMAIDVRTGHFIWKHAGLYDPARFSFSAFERPRVGPALVTFIERVDSPRRARTITVEKNTGRIGIGK